MLQIQSFPRHQRDTKFTLRLCCLKWRHIFLVLEYHSTLETCCKLCCWCWRHCWCWRWAIYCYVYFTAWALFVHALVEASKSGSKLHAAHSILPISPPAHQQKLKMGVISIISHSPVNGSKSIGQYRGMAVMLSYQFEIIQHMQYCGSFLFFL